MMEAFSAEAWRTLQALTWALHMGYCLGPPRASVDLYGSSRWLPRWASQKVDLNPLALVVFGGGSGRRHGGGPPLPPATASTSGDCEIAFQLPDS